MKMEYFKNDPKGVVVAMDSDNAGELAYSVWFPYTKTFIHEIKVGGFIAVRNYASQNGDNSFSILELVSAYPKHYALGSSAKDTERAFPGFVIEAAKNARVDWEQEEPIEQTTKIKCEGISTGLQLRITEDGKSKLQTDDSLPMIGEDAHLLTDEQINNIVNKGLLTEDIKTIEPCNLILNKNVSVRISTEDLLKTHFGVFGFTGAGKSNLLSGVINKLTANGEPNKIVLFDLMTEYTSLLIDVLHSYEDAYILCLTEDSLPGSKLTEEVIKGDESKIDEAAESIVRTLLLPKEIVPHRERYVKLVKDILKAKKIRLFDTGSSNPTISDLKAQMYGCMKGNLGSTGPHVGKMLSHHLYGSGVDPVSEDVLNNLKDDIDQSVSSEKMIDYTRQQSSRSQQSALKNQTQRTDFNRSVKITPTSRGCLIEMQAILNYYIDARKKEPLPEDATLSLERLYALLNKSDKPALVLVQSNRDDDLRDFSSKLVEYSFFARRISGHIFPHVLFVYDEADEFIPQQGKDSYAASKAGCTLLARRGRKFGLGLCLATQRVAYLDTSILAQPHTFLLSKLPRAYDREVIGKAFGASDEMIRRTLSFKVGQWLLFSYDATGLTNIPLPVQFPNSNKRLIDYLEKN